MAKLNFSAIASGRVNGQCIALDGSGTIDEELGLTIGSYNLRSMPVDFSPGLLTACLLTGYPNATATPTELTNPFQGRSYTYRRTLDFGGSCKLNYSADCRVESGELLSHFRLEGQAPSFELPARFVQEVEEFWNDGPHGELAGMFEARWTDTAGIDRAARAGSLYSVLAETRLKGVRRRLRLEAEIEGDVFRLTQNSKLTG